MATFDIKTLRDLIGQQVLHRGVRCTVVELLEKDRSLVLEANGPRGEIQDNQYGDPHRRVAETFTIPVFDEGKDSALHPELLALGLLPN